MKTLLLLIIVFVQTSFAQTNFYSTITNLWYQGYKTNVLHMAEQRLAVNTNDIAGLLIKADYDIAFTNIDSISNSLLRVLGVASTITSPNYSKQLYSLTNEVNHLLSLFTSYHPSAEDLENEKKKGLIFYKQLFFLEELKALYEDGYFNE